MSPGRGQIVALIAVWLAFGLGLTLLAPTLNGLKPGGVPLGYWYAAQGAPLVLVVMLVWMTIRRRA